MLPIETERLIIRTFESDDLEVIDRILNSAFGVQARLDSEQAQRERQSWLHWSILSQEWLPKLNQPPYGDQAVVLKSTGVLIGAVGLVPLLAPFGQIPELRDAESAQAHYTPEVGLYWVIDPAQRRLGYATEAARALVDLGFRHLHLRRLLATTEYSNAASQGVMRKLGMHVANNPVPDPPWLQIVGILENPG